MEEALECGHFARPHPARKRMCRPCFNEQRRATRPSAKGDEAARQRAAKWYAENRERALESMAEYRADPVKAARRAEQSRVWREKNRDTHLPKKRHYYQENKDRWREREYQKKFGLSLAEVDAMLEAQGNVCAICKADEPQGTGRFHVDHCHATGVVRRLLCHPCNTGLGLFKDDPRLLVEAAVYLHEWSGTP